jgi:hypothetical protein
VRFRSGYLSYPALLAALLALVLAILAAAETLAHHPGSHAERLPDGRVRLDAAAVAADACTTIEAIERGAPSSAKPPPGAEPVTVRLRRPDGTACATVVTAARRETVFAIPPEVKVLHLFIVGPDGVRATERVPIR